MRVTFRTEGGLAHFPGLARPVTMTDEDFSGEEAAELERRLEQARFFELAEEPAPKDTPPADAQLYTITVEQGRSRRTMRLTDPIEDPPLRELVHGLRRKARAASKAD